MMKFYLSVILFWVLGAICLADSGQTDLYLPPIETYITEPTVIENISIWVPAARSGPFINRSCRIKENLIFSSVLPASVSHQKTESCPDPIARILAELAAFCHAQSLPLTIFNGWQWEYSYSLCQYETVSYDLKKRGGCWENGWEAILIISCGAIDLQLLNINSLEKFSLRDATPSESTIEIKTFSSMRTRDGYPKQRQL